MEKFMTGIGGMTNGGKSTLSRNLQRILPNSCIISQDSFFKDDSVVPVDKNGFKQYDTLDALHMDRMMGEIKSWIQDPQSYMLSQGLTVEHFKYKEGCSMFSLIVEGFLIFNYGPLNELFDKRYFLQIPYETCKLRRNSRIYNPPDPEGYFDGYVWPMYLENRIEMESKVHDLVFLDGTQNEEDLLTTVYKEIQHMFPVL